MRPTFAPTNLVVPHMVRRGASVYVAPIPRPRRAAPPLRERLERAGVPETEPPEGGKDEGVWFRDDEGVWFRDPDGTPVQLLEAPQARPRDVPRGAVQRRRHPPPLRHPSLAAGPG